MLDDRKFKKMKKIKKYEQTIRQIHNVGYSIIIMEILIAWKKELENCSKVQRNKELNAMYEFLLDSYF